jgi:putative addiction module component (TIGR02574 family)
MITERIPGVQELSAAGKLSLASELWEELEGLGNELPISETHKRALDARYARHGDDPSAGSSWEQVKDRLLLLSYPTNL